MNALSVARSRSSRPMRPLAYQMGKRIQGLLLPGMLVELYRAKEVSTERLAYRYQVGQKLNPQNVLQLLRHSHSGQYRGPAVPAGYNSGLNIRLVEASS